MASVIKEQIETGDTNFHNAIIKFASSYTKMGLSQAVSSLCCFGKNFLDVRFKGKIKVQPAAVSRRRHKNGSRQKVDKSRKRKLELPNRKLTVKREHKLSKLIESDKPPAKKAGRTMISVTTYPKRKNKICKKEK